MDSKQHNHWINNPSKKQLLAATLIYLSGMGLLLLTLTDFFRQPVFTDSSFMLGFLIAGATAAVLRQYINYFRNRKPTGSSK